MYATRDLLQATPSQRPSFRQYGRRAAGFRSKLIRIRPAVGQERPPYYWEANLTAAIICLQAPTNFRPVESDGRLQSLWPKFDVCPPLSVLRLCCHFAAGFSSGVRNLRTIAQASPCLLRTYKFMAQFRRKSANGPGDFDERILHPR